MALCKAAGYVVCGLTFEFTRVRKRAKPAVALRVQRRVKPHLGTALFGWGDHACGSGERWTRQIVLRRQDASHVTEVARRANNSGREGERPVYSGQR